MEKNIRHSQVTSIYTDKLDIIADIHGCYYTLVDLLEKLGYSQINGVWQHPERMAIFIGDYIDRGLNTLQALKLIKNMTDAGKAIALLGNHEYNYVAINTFKPDGTPYRSEEKRKQHKATDLSIPPEQRQFWVEWFKTLPFFIELENLRIIHAAWIDQDIEKIRKNFPNLTLNDNLIPALTRGHEIFKSLMNLLKGPEVSAPDVLPDDHPMRQHSGLRIKWWETYSGRPTYKQVMVDPMPDVPVSDEFFEVYKPYPDDAKTVIFGHYTIPGEPYITRPNATCIDFGAYKKNYLVAYRYYGEKITSLKNMVWVKYNPKDVIL